MNIDVTEDVDGWRDLAREFFKDEMLILRLGAELGGLEQALAVPFVGLDDVNRHAVGIDAIGDGQIDAREDPIVGKRDVAIREFLLNETLCLIEQTIVLVMKNRMDCRQCNVLVGPAITGDVVRVKQFVVVREFFAGCTYQLYVTGHVIAVGRQMGDAVLLERHRHKGCVVEECVVGKYRVRRQCPAGLGGRVSEGSAGR